MVPDPPQKGAGTFLQEPAPPVSNVTGKWQRLNAPAIPRSGETLAAYAESALPEAGACRRADPAKNSAAFSITPHSPRPRALPKEWQAPFAVSSLDPTAQGHTVLPPYG